jgi:hypothetical protein
MKWINKILGKKEDESGSASKHNGVENKNLLPNKFLFAGLEGKSFGRYSDNNKSLAKTQSWYKSEDLFKEKKYHESFAAYFEYLRDDEEDNVHFKQEGETFTFDLLQGSKKVSGKCDGKSIICCVPLASMPDPNIAVMRRLLDMNFNLYYSRTALKEDGTLYMIFDTDVNSASTSKMYYAMRELATKADRQDDILLADFNTLKPVGTEHITPLTEDELEFKYRYFKQWIEQGLAKIEELNQDSFSGAIAYLLPGILYRIDFLIVPEAKILAEIERVSGIYWKRKEDTTLVERNQMMKDSIRKMLDTITKEQFAASVYHSKSTFAISAPPKPDKMRENIYNANRDSQWYINNKYPELALALVEYGLVYNQFTYSMPSILTELTSVFMAVRHGEYYRECGMKAVLYNATDNKFDKQTIEGAVDGILSRYREKFKSLKWDFSRMKYDSLYEFAISYTELMTNINLETKR